jgi:hypothetical protein
MTMPSIGGGMLSLMMNNKPSWNTATLSGFMLRWQGLNITRGYAMHAIDKSRSPEKQLSDADHHRAADLMIRQGGSFAAAIGEAYFSADSQNRKRLLDAFGDLFERFHREI